MGKSRPIVSLPANSKSSHEVTCLQEVDVSKGSSCRSVLVLAYSPQSDSADAIRKHDALRKERRLRTPSPLCSRRSRVILRDSTPVISNNSAGKAAGLIISDEVVGEGPAAKNGDRVTIRFTGWLMDGTKFDSSRDENEPFSFCLARQCHSRLGRGRRRDEGRWQAQAYYTARTGIGPHGAGNVIPPAAAAQV